MAKRWHQGLLGLFGIGLVLGLGGWHGAAYAVLLTAAAWPGVRLAERVVGRDHPAAVVTGAPVGYGLWTLALWALLATRNLHWWTVVLTGVTMNAAAWWMTRQVRPPLVILPRWTRRTSLALASLLLLAMVLVSVPFARIGERDADGTQRYRAYFTADFVWHRALVGELSRLEPSPGNPYFAGRPLHYYWTYFLPPAVATGLAHPSPGAPAPITEYLLVTALFSAATFVSVLFVFAWVLVPRAGPAALAVALTMVATSAEGSYALIRYWIDGRPLSDVQFLNIDALSLWWFGGLTIDGLPRALWYNPQHAMTTSLGLAALIIASRGTCRRRGSLGAFGFAGLCLALAITISPFPGAVFVGIYGLTVLLTVLSRRTWPNLLGQVAAAVPVALAVVWVVLNGMSAGAAGAVRFGSGPAGNHSAVVAAIALGPLLAWVAAGLVIAVRARVRRILPSVAGLVVAAAVFYILWLDAEPVWVGWRAGHVWMAVAPPVVALALHALGRLPARWPAVAAVAVWMLVGVPTTAIDWFNAQDTSNEAPAAGFRWTIRITPGEQEAFDWISRTTPANAVVQMATGPRGRETWSAIPSFARRRMAAGRPISLLTTEADQRAADEVDRLFTETDPELAWVNARSAGIDYLYAGLVEQQFFPGFVDRLRSRPDLFTMAFSNNEVSVVRVGCGRPGPCGERP